MISHLINEDFSSTNLAPVPNFDRRLDLPDKRNLFFTLNLLLLQITKLHRSWRSFLAVEESSPIRLVRVSTMSNEVRL